MASRGTLMTSFSASFPTTGMDGNPFLWESIVLTRLAFGIGTRLVTRNRRGAISYRKETHEPHGLYRP